MSDNWGYPNGAIPLDKMLKVEGWYFKPDAGHAIIAALAECRQAGIQIHINEGYRPLGVPADQKVKSNGNGDPAGKTSTGGSNQWFQYGRMKRGETPTAAYPGGSIHGWGKAADVSPGRSNPKVNAIFNKHGFTFDIGSESWHAHYVGGNAHSVSDGSSAGASNADEKSVQQSLQKLGLYSGPIDGVFGPNSWKGVQTFLTNQKFKIDHIDGVPDAETNRGLQTYAQKGGYTGPVDGVLGPKSWAGFAAALAKVPAPAAKPAAAPATPAAAPAAAPTTPETTPAPTSTTTPVAEKTATKPAAKPAAKPAPVKKVVPVSAEVLAEQDKKIAELNAEPQTQNLGAILPNPQARKIAYSIYTGVSVLIANISIGYSALHAEFPGWLTVAIAVIGNLAVPFGALAIANSSPKKK
jgi:hypothetical protein